MAKYIITWDIGFGPMADVIEAKSNEEAQDAAYEAAREDFESQASYEALPYSKKLAEEHGV